MYVVVTGGVLGTLAGLTYSAYRCGALWIVPTARSAVALLSGMLGGLTGSTALRHIGEIVGGACGAFIYDGYIESEESGEKICSGASVGAMIGCTLFGAVGAFLGRWSAIKMSNNFMSKYFPPKSVKSKVE